MATLLSPSATRFVNNANVKVLKGQVYNTSGRLSTKPAYRQSVTHGYADSLPCEHCQRDPGKASSTKKLFIYLLKSDSPVNRTGLFTQSNLTQVDYNTTHARFTNVKHINILI